MLSWRKENSLRVAASLLRLNDAMESGVAAASRTTPQWIEPVWQAEFFYRRNGGESYWLDFPCHVSECLERGCDSGMSFVFHLKTGAVVENRSGMTPPDPKKPRNDDDPIDPALKDVYLLDTSAMRQTNLFHGCPRRIRKTMMLADEYKRVCAWKAAGRESPGR